MVEACLSKNFGCIANTSRVMYWNVFRKCVLLRGIMKKGNLGLKCPFSLFELLLDAFAHAMMFGARIVEIGCVERKFCLEER